MMWLPCSVLFLDFGGCLYLSTFDNYLIILWLSRFLHYLLFWYYLLFLASTLQFFSRLFLSWAGVCPKQHLYLTFEVMVQTAYTLSFLDSTFVELNWTCCYLIMRLPCLIIEHNKRKLILVAYACYVLIKAY